MMGGAAMKMKVLNHVSLVVSDVELDVSYRYPDGRWRHPPGFNPRT